MKHRYLMLGIFVSYISLYGFASPGFAESAVNNPTAKTYDWSAKLNRGVINIVSSPVEIARDIQVTSAEKNLLNGWTVGLLRGIGDGFIRLGAGVVDMLTCPFNFPDAHKGPLVQPEFVWERPGVKYS